MDKSKLPKELMSLPTPFLRLLLDNRYDKGDSEFSTTQLISPPQRTWIKAQGHEEVFSIISSYYAVLGTILHRVIEDYALPEEGEFAEQRIHTTIQDRKVSGCIDLYETDTRTVSDWKFVGGVQTEIKDEHLKQLQINGYLAELHGWTVNHVGIVYFQRDWKTLQALVDHTYPKSGIKPIIVDYDREHGIHLLETTVKEHIDAKNGNPRECTLSEKWQDPPTYAILKNGGKRAINGGLCSTLAEAHEKMKPGHFIQHRPAQRTFCEFFCKLKHACPQYKRESSNEANTEP
jgi:hypothetical protein